MGYNNHHAGMHMIWHKHYAPYDDLEFYDQLAEKAAQMKRAEEKELQESPKDSVCAQQESAGAKKAMNDSKRIVDKTAKNNENKKQNKKPQSDTTPFPRRPKYGEEMILDNSVFLNESTNPPAMLGRME